MQKCFIVYIWNCDLCICRCWYCRSNYNAGLSTHWLHTIGFNTLVPGNVFFILLKWNLLNMLLNKLSIFYNELWKRCSFTEKALDWIRITNLPKLKLSRGLLKLFKHKNLWIVLRNYVFYLDISIYKMGDKYTYLLKWKQNLPAHHLQKKLKFKR